jgi:hypothetical protein
MPVPALRPITEGLRVGGNLAEQVRERSARRLDIPTAIGGEFDQLYDTAVEQPQWAEDDVDVVGPSVGETTDALGITDGLDPTSGDDSGLSGQNGVRVIGGLVVALGVIVAVGQLFTVNIGDSDG